MLEELVYKFRNAIEEAKDNGEKGAFFYKFPVGQCGVTSDMLAQFLIENGITNIKYTNGAYYGDVYEDGSGFECQNHTWLIVDDCVVDITADQFANHKPPLRNTTKVYVGPMTDYYRQYEGYDKNAHRHIGIESYWSNSFDLKSIYKTILKYI